MIRERSRYSILLLAIALMALVSTPAHAQISADAITSPAPETARSYSVDSSVSQTERMKLVGSVGVATKADPNYVEKEVIQPTSGTVRINNLVQHTAGTVRINNLANLETLLNILVNGVEIVGLVWGGSMIINGVMNKALKRVLLGAAIATGGLAIAGTIVWLVAAAQDVSIFS